MAEAGTQTIEGAEVEFIEAEFVTVRQSSVRAIEGGHIELQQVGALSIDGDKVDVTQGASAIVHGSDIRLNQSLSLITAGNNTVLDSSCSPVVLSRGHTTLNRSAVGILGAQEIKADQTSSFLMIANRIEGEVTTLLDWRSALAAGAAIGGILGLLSLLRRR